MAYYLAKRTVFIVLVFFALSFLIFAIYSLVPGDPARSEIEPFRSRLTAEQYEQLYRETRIRMGLDDPFLVRYSKWMGNLLRLELGHSNKYNLPVKDVLRVPMRNTILLNIGVIFFGLLITIPLGIAMAVRKNSFIDRSVQLTTLVGVSVPSFIVALLFIYFFAVRLGWFPVSGMGTPNFSGTRWEVMLDTAKYLVLPVSVLILSSLPGTTRYIRAAMISALSMDYIRTARAKGLKERVVIYSHAWRNALLPVITLLIGWFLSVFSGSLVIENMFALRGMGNFFIQAISDQDWNVALAIQMFYVMLSLISNLLIDVSYGIVDPRVRISS